MTTSHSVKSILIRDKCSMVIVKDLLDYTKEANGEAFLCRSQRGQSGSEKSYE